MSLFIKLKVRSQQATTKDLTVWRAIYTCMFVAQQLQYYFLINYQYPAGDKL